MVLPQSFQRVWCVSAMFNLISCTSKLKKDSFYIFKSTPEDFTAM